MFLDQGSTGFTIKNNHFANIEKSPLRFHQAGKNTARDNLWVSDDPDVPFVRYNRTPEENITLTNNIRSGPSPE